MCPPKMSVIGVRTKSAWRVMEVLFLGPTCSHSSSLPSSSLLAGSSSTPSWDSGPLGVGGSEEQHNSINTCVRLFVFWKVSGAGMHSSQINNRLNEKQKALGYASIALVLLWLAAHCLTHDLMKNNVLHYTVAIVQSTTITLQQLKVKRRDTTLVELLLTAVTPPAFWHGGDTKTVKNAYSLPEGRWVFSTPASPRAIRWEWSQDTPPHPPADPADTAPIKVPAHCDMMSWPPHAKCTRIAGRAEQKNVDKDGWFRFSLRWDVSWFSRSAGHWHHFFSGCLEKSQHKSGWTEQEHSLPALRVPDVSCHSRAVTGKQIAFCGRAHLLWEAGLDEGEEFVDVGRFKRNTRTNVFHDLLANSCRHTKSFVGLPKEVWEQTRVFVWTTHLAVWFSTARACCWIHSRASRC